MLLMFQSSPGTACNAPVPSDAMTLTGVFVLHCAQTEGGAKQSDHISQQYMAHSMQSRVKKLKTDPVGRVPRMSPGFAFIANESALLNLSFMCSTENSACNDGNVRKILLYTGDLQG